MPHKYLNEIGIKSKNTCIFNTSEKDKYRQKRFMKQRRMYGFDERETWSMDFTLACWIYSHFKWYKEFASKTIDLTYHKFDIPQWNGEIIEQTITVNQEEAIDIVIDNLEYYLLSEEVNDEEVAFKKYQYALRIVSIIIPAMWW